MELEFTNFTIDKCPYLVYTERGSVDSDCSLYSLDSSGVDTT